MKVLLALFVLLILLVPIAPAVEGPDYAVAVGMSYNPYMAAPEVSGNFLFGKKIAEKTYAFSFVDVVSRDKTKFAPATSFTEGIGIETININDKVRIYASTGAGIIVGSDPNSATSNGNTIGYSWNVGPAMSIALGKGWFLMPNARYFRSGLTDAGWIGGILIGWGH